MKIPELEKILSEKRVEYGDIEVRIEVRIEVDYFGGRYGEHNSCMKADIQYVDLRHGELVLCGHKI